MTRKENKGTRKGEGRVKEKKLRVENKEKEGKEREKPVENKKRGRERWGVRKKKKLAG